MFSISLHISLLRAGVQPITYFVNSGCLIYGVERILHKYFFSKHGFLFIFSFIPEVDIALPSRDLGSIQ